MFTDEIYPGARAEPRMPPPVYKAISDAIQSCQLNGQNPEQAAAAASEQIDAFLAELQGRADHLMMDRRVETSRTSQDAGASASSRFARRQTVQPRARAVGGLSLRHARCDRPA